MGLLCNPGGRNSGCRCVDRKKSCQCACGCQTEEVSSPEPTAIRAMLNYVLDSCCTTEDVCREITIEEDQPVTFNMEELCVGQPLNVELADDIAFKEVSRCKDECACLSTVRFSIPVRIYSNVGNGCGCSYIDRDICVVRSAKLCCTADSQLTAFNSKVLAVSAVVSDITDSGVTVCLCILFRSCLQQIALREFTWEAAPVCSCPECGDTRKYMLDPCDTLCGCPEGSKICPSCD